MEFGKTDGQQSHDDSAIASDVAAQPEPGRLDAGVRPIFVEVTRTEPLPSYQTLCIAAALLVGITLGRLAERLAD